MIFHVQNQPIEVVLCFSFGYLSGFLLTPLLLFNSIFKNKIFLAFVSVFEFLCFSLAFVFLKNAYKLGEFRLYMGAICLLGFYIYKKTLGKSIAILLKKLYNKLYKWFTLWRKHHNDRRKIKKNTGCDNVNCHNIIIPIGINNGLPNGYNKGQKGKNRPVKARNSHFGRAKRTNSK